MRVLLNIAYSFTITMQMHFCTRTFLVPVSRIIRYNHLRHISLSICPLLLFLLRWWLSVHPIKRTISMPTFNSNLFYWASRCLLWFDSTLLSWCWFRCSIFLSVWFSTKIRQALWNKCTMRILLPTDYVWFIADINSCVFSTYPFVLQLIPRKLYLANIFH